MPFQYGKENGKCYVRWGSRGTKFFYECGNREARERARKKADEDRKRIEYFKHNQQYYMLYNTTYSILANKILYIVCSKMFQN